MTQQSIGIVIPTYNGGKLWQKVVSALEHQKRSFDEILIIDSGSNDATLEIAQDAQFKTLRIPSTQFNHGGTRNLGVMTINSDIVIFITQDAILEPSAIQYIIKAFGDPKVAVAFGRQIYHDDANPLARHARLFNYKDTSYVYSKEDRAKHGIKTVFSSNSFAAYRIKYFNEIGGFPKDTIFAEDMYFTSKALQRGYKVAYVANAVVKHSHNYSILEEFRRSFDIGVFHNIESWILDFYGNPGGEGIRFVKSELNYLINNKKISWIPIAFINNIMKFIGYKLGLNYSKLPLKSVKFCSMHRKYWN